MITSKKRFHGYGSLKFVYSKGKTVRSSFVSLKYVPNSRRRDSRLAVVVSKKVAKKAPVRNRIRRRLYEAVRLQWPSAVVPHDMVISVFDERIATMPSDDIQKTVKKMLEQAKLA